MIVYTICDLRVQSDLPLFELTPVEGDRADSALRLLDAPLPDVAREWIFDWKLDDGQTWLACARHAAGYLLRFPGIADFEVSPDGREMTMFAAPKAPADTLRHLFLDQVFPLSLSLRGELALHASAIETPRGAAAFVGETGDGKSTLTASFAQAGFPPLADDCLLLRECRGEAVALPSYPGLRLWPDTVRSLAIDGRAPAVAHYTDKRRVFFDRGRPAGPVPLRRVYVLGPECENGGSSVSIQPLSRRDAVIELIKHAYRLEIAERGAIAAELDRVERVCRACYVRRLAFPRTFDSLPDVRDAILEDLRDG